MTRLTALIDRLAPMSAEAQLQRRRALPALLMGRARARNPALASRAGRLDTLAPRLDAPRPLYRAELCPPLVELETCREGQALENALARLEVIAGARELRDGPEGVYRLAHRGLGTLRWSEGRVQPRGAPLALRDLGLLYPPDLRLFADLRLPEQYADAERGDWEKARDRLGLAFAALEAWDPGLLADLRRAAPILVPLPPRPVPADRPWPPQALWSFNLRMRLPGVLFINPFTVGLPGLCEALLHEYTHQRIWLWWALCPPDELPPWSAWMRSPVSGQRRPVRTLLHAALIFDRARALHATLCASEGLDDAERAWAERRRAHLDAQTPVLIRALRDHISAGSPAARLLDQAGL